MRISRFMFPLAVLFVAAAIAGCGGSGAGNSSTSRGALRFNIQWPERGRLIPVKSESIRLLIQTTDNVELGRLLIPRPPSGQTSTTATINDLPAIAVKVTALASPNSDGSGNAQAVGSITVTVKAGETITTQDLVMGTTISQVQVTSDKTSLAIGQQASLAAFPRNAQNELIVVDNANFTWSSSDGTGLSLSGTGSSVTATAAKAGTYTVTARENESGKSGTTTVTVTPASAGNPTIFIADAQNKRIVGIDNISGANFTAFADPFAGSWFMQDVALDSTGHIYAAEYPQRIVRVDNLTGANLTVYTPSSPASYIHVDKNGRIYYRDDNLNIVRINDMSGAGKVSFGGISSGLFNGPQGIATDSTFRIYVADAVKNRIYRFDDMTGANPVFFEGDGVSANLDLGGVSGGLGHNVAVDSQDRIYVPDFNNHRVVRFEQAGFVNAASANLTAFSAVPAGPSGTTFKPLAIAVDSAANPHITFTGVYVDGTGNFVDFAVFRMDDMAGTNLARFGTKGSGTGQINAPFGVAVK